MLTHGPLPFSILPMSFVSAAVGPGVVSSAVEPPAHEVAAENRLVMEILSVAFLHSLTCRRPSAV